ncbi:MAG: SUMF1/EgtB/PvdO family nonheme iron enzyme [Gammaproteobacteria bacterium]|nr:SUMF1/EgtB/PvdO family nonheme iron enzyme [Gammaproteobacteria bacterium]
MINHQLLGQLAALQGLMMQLAENSPEAQFQRQIHPELGSLAHILGSAVYRELYWLRELVQQDGALSQRVEKLFRPGALPLAEQCRQLPPQDHLLNWAAEIQDQHLQQLANPGLLPDHPLLQGDAILYFILQEHALSYERMLSLQLLLQLQQQDLSYRAGSILESRLPQMAFTEVNQGAYRIGSSADDPWAYDNELPQQIIQLSAFAIAQRPVNNAEYLGFIEDAGYQREDLWGSGKAWLRAESRGAPLHWRKDGHGHWYGLGLNGPADLIADEPVQGISQYEAKAFAAWADLQGGTTAGAVLPHEFQWEAAVRTQAIQADGRVWEWCNNLFKPYEGYQRPASSQYATADFDDQHLCLRGGCLHTQPLLRRTALRQRALPHWNFAFSGLRLVIPPGKPFWEKD